MQQKQWLSSAGAATYIGRLVRLDFDLLRSAPPHGLEQGKLQISGLLLTFLEGSTILDLKSNSGFDPVCKNFTEGKMEKYRYGPLIFVTQGMDEEEGNYYWNGSPPVGYDADGIPIDKNGLQCLDILCPLHPGYVPTETEYNNIIQSDLPTLASFRQWFDDNFLIVNDRQLKKYIFKSWTRNNKNSSNYYRLLSEYKSVDELIGAIWQQEEHK